MKNIFQYRIIQLSLLIFLLALSACKKDDPPADDIPTSNIYLSISGSQIVSKVGFQIAITKNDTREHLRLEKSARLVAFANGIEYPFVEYEIAGDPYAIFSNPSTSYAYTVVIPNLPANTLMKIAYLRSNYPDALNSEVVILATPTMSTPVNDSTHSQTQDLEITWPKRKTKDSVSVKFGGNLYNTNLSEELGMMLIPYNNLSPPRSQDVYTAQLTLIRYSAGVIDNSLGGGDFMLRSDSEAINIELTP